MVHLVNFFLFWHLAIFTIERHRNFGFQIPLPLFLPLRRNRHSSFSVPKLMRYSKDWDVDLETTFGTTRYSISNDS